MTTRSHDERVADLERSIRTVLTPRPTQGPDAAAQAVRRGIRLAGMVRDTGADTLGAYLDKLDRGDLYALTVALAAMVDIDQRPADLLAWVTTLEQQEPAA